MTKIELCNYIIKKAVADDGSYIKKELELEWISNISFQPSSVGSEEGFINIWLYKVSGEPNKKTFRIRVKSIDRFIAVNALIGSLIFGDEDDDWVTNTLVEPIEDIAVEATYEPVKNISVIGSTNKKINPFTKEEIGNT